MPRVTISLQNADMSQYHDRMSYVAWYMRLDFPDGTGGYMIPTLISMN